MLGLQSCLSTTLRKHPGLSFFSKFMACTPTLDVSPPVHRWMDTALQRDAFKKTIPILAAKVSASKTGSLLKSDIMKKSLMNLPKVRSVLRDPHDDLGRLVLLNVSEDAALSPEVCNFLQEQSATLVVHNLELTYDYWTADEILHSILPEELCKGSPSGFAITGHLAHMNLNKEYLPYKHIIGQIVLDKNPMIKTVVNKLDSIDTKYRFFKMELLAGEPNYVVEHHESNCRFTFDFTHVYWNSRLHTEHDRLVQLFQPTDVIADVFAGVGPFAIPAAKKGCAVLANDLNPESARYLSQNIVDNKVTSLVRASCEDGRDFIKKVIGRARDHPFPAYTGPKLSKMQEKERRKLQLAESRPIAALGLVDLSTVENQSPRHTISHFVMNLPDSAIDFLDAFRGILSESEWDFGNYANMPMIHCHCFTRELHPDRAEADIIQRVENKLGHKLETEVTLHMVRSVAPNKDMYCISFRLPRDVAFAQ
ncbi:Met-10+ like-protein-domain-containing protein [Suillus discolor]|uniref:tRNA (guanine(37)-N1)-methyltransferase n=1 Tax=Suillus discolor TaxID=1912936 RepID=A0A9P7JYZ6_9AGAM|nr:Met-10+ like-protein-domain-containing protein [Suillus discolor]KAG2117946.1 Met-10+ like-protein-domain-containing protein [Suillus discolor]